jgi:hypothetical protein
MSTRVPVYQSPCRAKQSSASRRLFRQCSVKNRRWQINCHSANYPCVRVSKASEKIRNSYRATKSARRSKMASPTILNRRKRADPLRTDPVGQTLAKRALSIAIGAPFDWADCQQASRICCVASVI